MALLTKKRLTKKGITKQRAGRDIVGRSTGGSGSALMPGPSWGSFEKFRVQGAGALSQIKPGAVGILTSQGRQFRVMHENDFQQIIGLARESDRARQGLRVIHAAVRTVQEHPGQSSLNTLVEAALLLSESPVLPTRRRFELLQPERGEQWADDAAGEEDEVELNPKAVRRPFESQSESQGAA